MRFKVDKRHFLKTQPQIFEAKSDVRGGTEALWFINMRMTAQVLSLVSVASLSLPVEIIQPCFEPEYPVELEALFSSETEKFTIILVKSGWAIQRLYLQI